MRNLKSRLLSFTRRFLTKVMPLDALTNLYELELRKEIRRRQMEHPNPFCRYGAFGFSQSDEDGLTIEILSRMGISKGFFCEFGVGDGTENNTLILLALGWSGSWFGGQDIILDVSKSSKLTFTKTWITKENILSLYKTIASEVDVISLDLDGNDFHFIEELLRNGANPKLFIAEYNAKFPPGVKFTMPYNPQHFWKSDDYFGASLQMFVELFSQFGYRLICCNAATGANAFFVKEEYAEKFPEVPVDIKALYSEPFYLLRGRKMHPTSVKTLQSLLQ